MRDIEQEEACKQDQEVIIGGRVHYPSVKFSLSCVIKRSLLNTEDRQSAYGECECYASVRLGWIDSKPMYENKGSRNFRNFWICKAILHYEQTCFCGGFFTSCSLTESCRYEDVKTCY